MTLVFFYIWRRWWKELA